MTTSVLLVLCVTLLSCHVFATLGDTHLYTGNEISHRSHGRYRRQSMLNPKGKNVCHFKGTKVSYSEESRKVSTLVKKQVCCAKWLRCWKKCTRNEVLTRTITAVVSRLVDFDIYHCCDGYSVDDTGVECSKPICNPYCRNGGLCIAPNRCKCTDGFDGRFCQIDKNECSVPEKTGCSQQCINLPGTFSCACRRGYVPLDPLSKKCQDIDECRHNPCKCTGKNCNNLCINTPGSYKCSCGSGYRLSRWNLCTDRNECVEDPDLCPQKCVNLPGTYQCHCWPGFKWNTQTKKCDEVNECSVGNGGCEHNCHNVFGGHVCSCKSGFFLAPDRFSCTDFNECNGVTECDKATSVCVNTDGDYYCNCRSGFKYSSNNRTCEDRDECLEKTDLCDQECRNAFGSYTCSCRTGFRLKADRISCEDIDECKNKVCSQRCANTIGSFYCACNPGYLLDADGRSCKPQMCEKVFSPFYGDVTCNGYTLGKICKYSCQDGYNLSGNESRTCLPNGRWSGVLPTCVPKNCPQPKPPANGKVTLPCEVSYGATCPVTCNWGYVRRGGPIIQCVLEAGTLKWNVDKVQCEEILVCKPNPCQHNGKCSIVSPTEYHCDCSGTGFEGRTCAVGVLSLPHFPKMQINIQSPALSIGAKPTKFVDINITPNDPDVVISPNSKVSIKHPATSVNFYLTSKSSGLKSLSFTAVGSDTFKRPSDVVIIFHDPKSILRTFPDFLTLAKPCYKLEIQANSFGCSSIDVLSSAPWVLKSNGLPSSLGVAVAKIDVAKIPLFATGADPTHTFSGIPDSRFSYVIPKAQGSCSSKVLSTSEQQYMAMNDIFAKTFMSEFNKLTPPWFTVALGGKLAYFGHNSIRAFIWSGKQVKQYDACSTLAINKMSFFVVYLHKEHIALNVHGKSITMRSKGVFCFAVDVCSGEPHLAIPADNRQHLENLLSFDELSSLGWSVKVKAVGFSKKPRGLAAEECLSSSSNLPNTQKVLLGQSDINFKEKNNYVSANIKGDIFMGIITKNSKQNMVAVPSCVRGNSRVDTPSWYTTDRSLEQYKKSSYDRRLTFDTGAKSGKQESLVFTQHHLSVFKMKSGLSPILVKDADPIKIDFKYEETKTSSSGAGEDNFGKITMLQMLSLPLMDLELGMAMVTVPNSVRFMFTSAQSKISTWSLSLGSDVNDLILQSDNTKLVNDKLKLHYYKGKGLLSELRKLSQALKKASMSSDFVNKLDKSIQEMDVILKDMEKGIAVKTGPKVFTSLSLKFKGSVCMFKPCLDDTMVSLTPLYNKPGSKEFCYNQRKLPFETWQTTGKVSSDQKKGLFFTFKKDSEFLMCLETDGVRKATILPSITLFGHSFTEKLLIQGSIINPKDRRVPVLGKHEFDVSYTINVAPARWNMMKVPITGKSGLKSTLVVALQKEIDGFVATQYFKLKAKVDKARKAITSLQNDENYFRGESQSNKQSLTRAQQRYAQAKTSYDQSKKDNEKNKGIFSSNRQALLDIEAKLNKECPFRPCPITCIKIDNCDVCQKPVYINKTVPKCSVSTEDRSYNFTTNYMTRCSHKVQDRTLKYTGNCPEPKLEPAMAKSIMDRINYKVKNNQSLTIGDALDLQLINKTAGKNLQNAIEKGNFFKRLPELLKLGLLIDSDFEKLARYTNQSFADQIREQQKSVLRAKVLVEIFQKINRSQALTDEDFKKVEKVDPELAKKLRNNQAISEIMKKLQEGKNLTKADVSTLKAINPKLSTNVSSLLLKQLQERSLLVEIQQKISKGSLSAADLKRLEASNPEMAKKLKEALKEQLKKKVQEMEKKLKNVKNTIGAAFNGSDFASLTDQLQKLSGTTKPIDRASLEKLQKKINKVTTSLGSVFENIFQRLDLDLEIQNITGVSKSLQKTINAFVSTLAKFDLPKILQGSEKWILQRLEDIQEWFKTAVKFIRRVCGGCSKACDSNNSVDKLLSSLKTELSGFISNVCQRKWKVGFKFGKILETCKFLSEVKSFLDQAKYTAQQCSQIEDKVAKPLAKVAEIWKQIRLAVPDTFKQQWQNGDKTKQSLADYVSFATDLGSTLRTVSSTVTLKVKAKYDVLKAVEEIVRSGKYTVKLVDVEVALGVLKEVENALKMVPTELKRIKGSTISLNIGAAVKLQMKSKLDRILNGASLSLYSICSGGLGITNQDKTDVDTAKRSVKKIFDEFLIGGSISKVYIKAEHAAALLKQYAEIVSKLYGKVRSCVSKEYISPLATLNDFLSKVKPLVTHSYKDLLNDVRNNIREVGKNIAVPIGKIVDSVKTLVQGMPKFDIPLFMFLSPKNNKLTMNALREYFETSAEIFSGMAKVVEKCPKCLPGEVFGVAELKDVTEKFDKVLKPISKGIHSFTSKASFGAAGLSLLQTSMERTRTSLQRIYRSQTAIDAKGFADVVSSLKESAVSVQDAAKSYKNIFKAFATAQNKEIKGLTNSIGEVTILIRQMYEKLKSDGGPLKSVYSQAYDLYNDIKTIPQNIEELKTGPISRRLSILRKTGDLVKDIPVALKKLVKDKQFLILKDDLEDLGSKLDTTVNHVESIIKNTQQLYTSLKMEKFDYEQSKGTKSVSFRQRLTELSTSSMKDREAKVTKLVADVKNADIYTKGVTAKAASVFDGFTGAVDGVKEKVFSLRRKLDKYKDIYKEFETTLGKLKKGPLSQIGKIKDSAETLADSISEYDFKKMLSSDPRALSRKLAEFRQLVTLTGSSMSEIDRILKHCNGCSIEGVFGYTFVKDLVSKVGSGFEKIYNDVEGFTDKLGDVAGEFANTSKTLKKISDRFKGILGTGKIDHTIFKKLSEGLLNSYKEIDMFQQGSTRLAKLILGEDVDLSVIWSTTDSLVHQFENVLNKSAKVATNVQNTWQKVKTLKENVKSLQQKAKTLKGGPPKVRVEIAKELSKDVKEVVNSLPGLMSSSKATLASIGIDGNWVDKMGEKVELLVGSLNKMMKRTDLVLKAAGVAVEGVEDISNDLPDVKSGFQKLFKAPWDQKVTELRNVASKIGNVMDKAISGTIKTANALNISLSKNDLLGAAQSVIGQKRMQTFVEQYSKLSRVLVDLENGPIDEIGKLTDSVDSFVEGLKDYDLGKALLSNPASLREKVTHFQQLAATTAEIYTNISRITGFCASCTIENILGKKFVGKISQTLGSKFKEIHENMTDIYKRVKVGYKGWEGFVGTAKTISDAFKGIGTGSVTPDTFTKTAEALRKSASNLQSLKSAASDVFQAFFDDQDDLKRLQEQFDGLVSQVSGFMNKTAVVSDKVEGAYRVGLEVKSMYDEIKKNVEGVTEGPVEARVKVVRKIMKGVNGLIGALPELMNKSADASGALGADGAWLRRFGHKLTTFSSTVQGVVNTTDKVLEGVGLTVKSVGDITRLSEGIKGDFGKILSAPWPKKFEIFNGALKKMGSILDNVDNVAGVVDSTLKDLTGIDYNISSNVLNMTTGVSGFLGNVSSAVNHVQEIYKDVAATINAVKSGPVSKIGKLTDSVNTFIKNVKNYDIREILLLSPKFAKEKLTEIKDIIKETGVIMGNISDVVNKVCPTCKLDTLFGGKFMNMTTQGLEEALNKVVGNSSFLEKVGEGAEGIAEVIGSVNGIRNNIAQFKLLDFSSNGFKKLSGLLSSSSDLLDKIKNDSGNVFDTLFGKDQDMLTLKGKFEGFVTNIASFLDKASNLSDKASDAMGKVEAVKKTFNDLKGNLDKLKEGPLESRVKVVQNMVQGVSSIMSGLPDLLKSASLGLDSTSFLRNMGTQLEGFTNGVQRVLNKTNLVLDDVGSVIGGVGNVVQTSKALGEDFQKILRAPWSKKFDVALQAVSKVRVLTQQINMVADNASSIFQTLTGTTLTKTSIFGNGTAEMLGKISNGISLIADRYEKFRGLTKTVGEAFHNISTDPIGFALEGLPRLFEEADKFVNTLISDSQGLLEQLGVDLDGINLSPQLVAAAKNFYGFAKGALGTIQSGKTLIGDFKNLFESKNFKDAMVNFKKVTDSGNNFIDNLDSVGQYLFKDDWKDMKGDFKEALDEVGESLGINMEKVGEWLNTGLETVTGLISIATNLEDLFKMKEFNVETVAVAAKKLMTVAKTAVGLMNKFGANIQTAALNKIASAVTVVTSVVQIVVGVKNFIKWMNDVCDLTYETVVINKEISYVCLKEKIQTEVTKVPIETCTFISKKIQSGFSDSDMCCKGKECVYMQDTKCLANNKLCFDKRASKLGTIADIQKDLVHAYEALERSRLKMETALIDMKSAQYLMRRSSVALNISTANLHRTRVQLARTKKVHAESNADILKLVPLFNKIQNKSNIVVQQASFQLTLYDPNIARVPLQIDVLDESRKAVTVNVVVNRTDEVASMKLMTRQIFVSVTDFIPRRKKRAVGQGYRDELLEKWASVCATLMDDVDVLRSIVLQLSTDVNAASESPSFAGSSLSGESKDPTQAMQRLQTEVKLFQRTLKRDIPHTLRHWKQQSESILMAQDETKCTDYSDCVTSLIEKIEDLFEPVMGSYKQVQQVLQRLSSSLLSIGSTAVKKSSVLLLVKTSLQDLDSLLRLAEFCDSKPKFQARNTYTIHAYIGERFSLSCGVLGKSRVSYIWKRNGTAISDQQREELVINSVEKDDQGPYTCEASNLVGTSISRTILVLVSKRPIITTQPKDVQILPGVQQKASFYCNISSDRDIQLKWLFTPFTGPKKATLKGSSPELQISNVKSEKVGYYWCEATDGTTILRSRKAKLSIVRHAAIREVGSFDLWLHVAKRNIRYCNFISDDKKYLGAVKQALIASLSLSLKLKQGESEVRLYMVGNFWSNETAKLLVSISFGGKTTTSSEASLAVSASNKRNALKERIDDLLSTLAQQKNALSVGQCEMEMYSEASAEVDWRYNDMVCPPGMEPSQNRIRCVECPEGSYDIGVGRCLRCLPGTYQNVPGSLYCEACGSNQLTNAAGTASASMCSVSDYSCNSNIRVVVALAVGSGLTKTQWLSTVEMTRLFLKTFDPALVSSRFSLVTFGEQASVRVAFGDPRRSSTYLKDLENLFPSSKESRKDLMLRLAKDLFELSTHSKDERRILIVVGQDPPSQTAARLSKLKSLAISLKSLDVDIFHLSVGGSTEFAKATASAPPEKYIMRVKEFSRLKEYSKALSYNVCRGV